MNLQAIDYNRPPMDIIVQGKGDQVKVELDIRNNDPVRIGDRYIAPRAGYVTVLRVVDFEYADNYDNVTARQTHAMREGVVGVPTTRAARETFQRKLAVMRVEGELWENGRRVVGAGRLPERLTPVYPIGDDTLEQFTVSPDGNASLGLLRSSSRVLDRVAQIAHNFAGERLVIFGMPGKGKSQEARALISQLMAEPVAEQAKALHHPIGVLVLDRAGEYVQDTQSEDGHQVYGLQHHPLAPRWMVVVSNRSRFADWASQGKIAGYLMPVFNIRDLEPIDLIDFYPGFTPTQRTLLRDYAHDPNLYTKLLRETKLGQIDKNNWYRDFPGLFELKDKGKKLLKEFEREAAEGDALNDEQLQGLEPHLTGTKSGVLERAILGIKRFAQNPFFGSQRRAKDILAVRSCADEVIAHLEAAKTVVVDLRGVSDDNYTLIGALFARRLINENKRRDDADQIRACIVMEEAHNILAEDELYKGSDRRGSVFVEFAREGRKLKLGFVLVTQQPDPRSIASEIAWTIDTVIAFHMPPDNAKYLTRLKSAFNQLEYYLANAGVFEGVAVASGGAILFRSDPVTPEYMQACAEQRLDEYLASLAPESGQEEDAQVEAPIDEPETIEDRLTRLLHQRNRDFRKQMEATLQAWQQPA
jgi:DNA helicase HerA-like ATPase